MPQDVYQGHMAPQRITQQVDLLIISVFDELMEIFLQAPYRRMQSGPVPIRAI
jgi:hypothetical protein